jgi:enoyl-CoA hydratase
MELTTLQYATDRLDGLMRNTSDALPFIAVAENQGVRAAVAGCDAPFGVDSQVPQQPPDPSHVVGP